MGEVEKRLKKIEYHQQLLLEMIQTQNFPAYRLIVKSDLSEEEVEEVFRLCEELSLQYEQQKEEGFVYFIPLLTQFIDLLNQKLDPEETIHAFLGQNIYVPLMEILKKSLIIVKK
ncbi:MAG TPA: DUF1878 family protein [Bacillales bacterium]|nr:DUF1878 family protein [Bacillales bacterium]